jgi:hypothetical protein
MSKIAKQPSQTETKYKPTNMFVVFLTIIISVIAYFLTGLFIVLLKQNNFNIRDFIANHNGSEWLSFGLGFLAFWLYGFKSRQQFWYGIIEIAFGFFSISMVSVRLKKTVLIVGVDPFSIIGGVSAAYLIIRGLSNVSEGYPKPFKWKNIVMKYSKQR